MTAEQTVPKYQRPRNKRRRPDVLALSPSVSVRLSRCARTDVPETDVFSTLSGDLCRPIAGEKRRRGPLTKNRVAATKTDARGTWAAGREDVTMSVTHDAIPLSRLTGAPSLKNVSFKLNDRAIRDCVTAGTKRRALFLSLLADDRLPRVGRQRDIGARIRETET